MIDYEEKFFSYLNDRMNLSDREEFENELNRSDDLKNDYFEYKKLNKLIIEIKNTHLSKDYSESIITDFRKRIKLTSLKKSSIRYKYAFASIFIIIVGYFLISSLNQDKPMEINSLLLEFSETELESLSRNIAYSVNVENNISDDDVNKIDSIYKENLSASLNETIEENRLDNIYSINNVSEIDEYLSENDVELIYAQLINKEIL